MNRVMYKRFLFCIGLFCLFLPVIGCGSNCSLKGKVVFSDDKSPVTQGQVCCVSDKGIARGTIDNNGNYVIGSVGAKDGLPPGTYKIYVTTTELLEPSPGGGLPRIVPQVDVKYTKAETSGLEIEVKKSMTYDFEVDRFKK